MFDEYTRWLREHGVTMEIATDLVRRPDFIGPLEKDADSAQWFDVDGAPIVEFRNVGEAFAADHATADVAAAMARPDVWQDAQRVWEIGCGTCILSILAAKAGAAVTASDIDERAVALGRQTLERAGVVVDLRQGSNADPMQGLLPANLVVANMPHKPCGAPGQLPVGQDGGADGDRHHGVLANQLRTMLPVGARLLTFLHSLPSPRLLARYNDGFQLTMLSWKVRWFGPEEFTELLPMYEERVRAGSSYLVRSDKRVGAIGCTWMATRL